MLIGQMIKQIGNQPVVVYFNWEMLSFRGYLRSKGLLLYHQLKLNIYICCSSESGTDLVKVAAVLSQHAMPWTNGSV